MPGAVVRLLLPLLLCALAAGASAAENIVYFSSDITVNTDGSLDVIETITVNAEGNAIRRGIFRDFPTSYRDRFNNRVRVAFEVLDVTRNEQPEQYALEPMSNGVRIRIGNPNVYLPIGPHTYTLRYRTDRQLGFFDDFDELYWNVTGNGWQFPIERAMARVRLPAGASIVQKFAYTGRYGETGSDYKPLAMPDGAAWETLRMLQPGEGLTIAIAWPKGIVREPTLRDRWDWFLRDNRGTGTALLCVLMIFGYYITVWRRYGRDPEPGAIIPRFEPPDGLSPAAVRFIRLMNFDRKAFSAAIVSMGVKGYLRIKDAGKGFDLERMAEPADLTQLAGGERRIAKHLLLTQDQFSLQQKNHAELRGAIRKLRESLVTEYEFGSFERNTLLFVTGLILSGGAVLLTAFQAGSGVTFVAGLLVAVIAALITFVGLHFWGDDADPTFKLFPFNAMPAVGKSAAVLQVLFFTVVMVVNTLGSLLTHLVDFPLQGICFSLLGGLNAVFFALLKRPTRAGRKIMDEIEGFRMYLETAEEQRLAFLHPPEKTPELFERYLPYAIALDVENAWADKFAAVLLAAANDPGQGSNSYSPRWYGNKSWTVSGLGKIGSDLGGVIASSARPPGSSSGSGGFSGGGGGFSGGGGGGGGGGGW